MKKSIFQLLILLLLCSPTFAQQKIDTSVRKIILVFKTHFDIGYTDYAEAVVQKYSTTMMQTALSVVEQNKKLPAEKQFVWTVSGWPMEQILQRCTPDLKPKIEAALKNKHFAIHALPFTVETESADMESLVRGLNISSTLLRKEKLPIARDAKMSDVPSHSWIIPTLLKQAGVNFLHLGCNPASQSPKVPLLFWWEGPDGSKLMTMYSAAYYGSSLLPPPDWPYKTWMALMLTNDNSGPPTPQEVDKLLAEAHATAPNATIEIGRMSDFYDALMKENPQLPVVKADMPDTWIHGFMSMPREVKTANALQSNLYTFQALNTLYNLWTPKGYSISNTLYDAYEQTLLFNEHTFGMAMSHGENGTWSYGDAFKKQRAEGAYTDLENSWKEKSDRVYAAEKIITPSLKRQLKELASDVKLKGNRIFVYNPLPWKRDGVVTLRVSSDWYKGKAVKDAATGEIVAASNDNNKISFVAKDIPPSGYRNYILINNTNSNSNGLIIDKEKNIIENQFFSLLINAEKGAIVSMKDKRTGKELVNSNSEYGFGQYLYERFSKEDADNYTQAYVKAFHKEWADAELGRPNLTEGPHVTEKGNNATVVYSQSATSVSATLLFAPTKKIPHDYSITITLYNNLPYAELNWNINSKPAEPWPEAGWISFPFNVENPQFKLGRLGAIVNPATDFVSGSNLDYGFLNTGMSIINPSNNGIGLSSPDAPGISLDRPGLWKYSTDFVPKQSNVFINLYNNVWSTNFTEWVEGSWSAKMYLWSVENYTNETAIITPSAEVKQPLVATMVNNGGGNLPVSAPGIGLSEKGILVTAFGENPDGKGTVLRLWEQAGLGRKITITLPMGHPYKTAVLCNLRGEITGKPFATGKSFDVKINAYQPLSLLLYK